jgi:hypothetical protein
MSASRAVLVAAVVANVLGWVLPAAADVAGYRAFGLSLSPLWAYTEFDDEPIWFLSLMVGSALTNLLFVVLVVQLFRGRASKPVLWAAAAATLLNMHWVFTMEADRRYLASGYFIWVCSFALLALAAFLEVRPRPR